VANWTVFSALRCIARARHFAYNATKKNDILTSTSCVNIVKVIQGTHSAFCYDFAAQQAKLQAEREQERLATETAKQRVQEQLLKKALLKQTRQAFEEERQRRIEMMESLLDADNEESLALAETNEKLSMVHEDLMNAFRLMEVRSKLSYNYCTIINITGISISSGFFMFSSLAATRRRRETSTRSCLPFFNIRPHPSKTLDGKI